MGYVVCQQSYAKRDIMKNSYYITPIAASGLTKVPFIQIQNLPLS
jgi:hypothetical protein